MNWRPVRRLLALADSAKKQPFYFLRQHGILIANAAPSPTGRKPVILNRLAWCLSKENRKGATMQYIPLAEQIKPYLKSQFLDIPAELQKRIALADPFKLWDTLTLGHRELLAHQHDYEFDPSREDERKYHENLTLWMFDIEDTLREWKSSNCQNDPLRMKIKKDEIAELQTRYSEVNSLFDRHYVTQEIRKEVTLSNLLKTANINSEDKRQVGITRAVTGVVADLMRESNEGVRPKPRKVMDRLLSLVGTSYLGVIISKGSASNSVKWETNYFTPKEYGMDALRRTLKRLPEYSLPPNGGSGD